MIDINTLNLIEIDPGAYQVISRVDSGVTIQCASFPDYLWSKYTVVKEFNKKFPEYPLNIVEPHDESSVVIYSRTNGADIDAVIRVCFDGGNGLPISSYTKSTYADLKNSDCNLAEPGRLYVSPDSKAFPYFMACIYRVAIQLCIDFYLMQVRCEHAAMYRKLFGAVDIEETKHCPGCTHLAWEIAATPERFLKRFPVSKMVLPIQP